MTEGQIRKILIRWFKDHQMNFISGSEWDFIASNGSNSRFYLKLLCPSTCRDKDSLERYLGQIILSSPPKNKRGVISPVIVLEAKWTWKKYCRMIPKKFRIAMNLHLYIVYPKGIHVIKPKMGISNPNPSMIFSFLCFLANV